MSRIITHLVIGLTLLIIGTAGAQTHPSMVTHQQAVNGAKSSSAHGPSVANSPGIRTAMRTLKNSQDIHSLSSSYTTTNANKIEFMGVFPF